MTPAIVSLFAKPFFEDTEGNHMNKFLKKKKTLYRKHFSEINTMCFKNLIERVSQKVENFIFIGNYVVIPSIMGTL